MEERIVLRPPVARLLAFATWTGAAAFTGLIGSIVWSGEANLVVVVGLAVVGAIVGTVSARRVRLSAGSEGVEIRNPVRTYQF